LGLLRNAVQRGALMIVGTTYRDPDLRRWLHVALSDNTQQHGALVLLARQGFELSREQFRQVETALADQWRSAGLEPVVMEDFADAAQIVRELRHVHLDGYSAPRERARAI